MITSLHANNSSLELVSVCVCVLVVGGRSDQGGGCL